jgi:hypothetical protein
MASFWVVRFLKQPNNVPKPATFKSPIAFPHRAKTSANLVIDAVSYQRGAFFFQRSYWKKIAFSFGTFLLAKQKKSTIIRTDNT